jgi:hypothetical protein
MEERLATDRLPVHSLNYYDKTLDNLTHSWIENPNYFGKMFVDAYFEAPQIGHLETRFHHG